LEHSAPITHTPTNTRWDPIRPGLLKNFSVSAPNIYSPLPIPQMDASSEITQSFNAWMNSLPFTLHNS
jgi:hypothetical protein